MTYEFDQVHSQQARDYLINFHIGNISIGGSKGGSPRSERKESPRFTYEMSKSERDTLCRERDRSLTQTARPLSDRWRMGALRSDEVDDGMSLVTLQSDSPHFETFLRGSYQTVTLQNKRNLTHDTLSLKFALYPDLTLGLPVGQYVMVQGMIQGVPVSRAYTPVSGRNAIGYFELVVKVYSPNKEFPVGGVFSQYLNSLNIGDRVEVKGPLGHIVYPSKGTIQVKGKAKPMRQLCMIAAGSGITPMFQLMKTILENGSDSTIIYLIFANRTEEDIILKAQLDVYANKYPNKFHVTYILSRPAFPEVWLSAVSSDKGTDMHMMCMLSTYVRFFVSFLSLSFISISVLHQSVIILTFISRLLYIYTGDIGVHEVGYVTPELVAKLFPIHTPENCALLCGSANFTNTTCMKALEPLGYKNNMSIYTF